MSQFDEADRQASAAFDEVLSDPVSFTPTRPKSGGDRVVVERGRNTSPYELDPSRERRPRSASDPFVAIVTWKSGFIGVSDLDQSHRDVIASNDVMIDFDRGLFRDADGVERLPMRGDLFDLPEADGETITVQQTRDAYDDGGARVVVFCIAPEYPSL